MRRKGGLLALLLIFALCAPARADSIGFFPGLDALIEQSAAIVILRVERPTETEGVYGRANACAFYNCYIYQAIKGEIAVNKPLPLRLADNGAYETLPEGSTWLVFLTKNGSENKDVPYASLSYVGSMVRVSPIGQEKAPEGDTPAEKVRNVLKAAVEYRRKEYEREQAYLQMLIEGKPDTDGSKSLPR